jgi:hypothetical protein
MGIGVREGSKRNTCADARNGNTETISGIIDVIGRGVDVQFHATGPAGSKNSAICDSIFPALIPT